MKTDHLELEEQNEKRMKKSKEGLWELWDTTKQTNICITNTPKGSEKEIGEESLFKEIMTENFSNTKKRYRYPSTESTKVSNQVQSKQNYTKTYDNQTVKHRS